jgi:DNA-binding CsgD family transcriptional regulator
VIKVTEVLPEYPFNPEPDLAVVGDDNATVGLPKVITPDTVRLTKRELELLEGASQGETIKQAAQKDFNAEQTIKFHRTSILRKLGANGIAQAVNIALNTGILTVNNEAIGTATAHEPLSSREREMLIASAWRPNAKVASSFGVEKSTVKFHKTNLFRKLGAANLAHAVRLGYEYGYFNHGPLTAAEANVR